MIKAHFHNIKEVIIAALLSAKQEIRIAVAWINNHDILSALDQKRDSVKITVITHDDEKQNSEDLEKLNSDSCKVYRFKKESGIMHHKFCVVDEHTLLTGSYNWTWGADLHNLENILMITEEPELIKQYIEEFDKIVPQYFAYVEETKALINSMIEKLVGLRNKIEKTNDVPTEIRYMLMPYLETKLNELNLVDVVLKLKLETEDNLPSLRKNKIDFKQWWNNKLSEDLKIHFNNSYYGGRKDLSAPEDSKSLEVLINSKVINIQNFIPKTGPDRMINLLGLNYLEFLEHLNLSGNKLNQLKGLQNLDYVKYLYVSNNQLTSLLDIKNYKSLQYIDCSINHLTHIQEISHLSSLRTIILSNNPIKSFNGLESLCFLKEMDIRQVEATINFNFFKNLSSLEKFKTSFLNHLGLDVLDNLKYLEITFLRKTDPQNIELLNNLEFLQINITYPKDIEIIKEIALIPNIKVIRILNYQKHNPDLTEFMETNSFIVKYTTFRTGGKDYEHPVFYIKSGIFENDELPPLYTWF